MKVVYTGSKNLYPYMKATIQSLLDYNKVDRIYLLIADDEFPLELPKGCKYTVINVSDQKYFSEYGINYTSPFTYFCLLRVCLADLLPGEDKIISSDVDTIINGDLTDMWNIDLTGKWFAMCPEYTGGYRPFGADQLYYNAGVALYNLAQIRKDNIVPTLVHYLNNTYARCMDQEAWNYYGQEKAVQLPVRFNETPYTGYTDNPVIIHFCGNMAWQRDQKMYRHEYLDKYIDRSQKYLIHTCNDREWYVENFLVPSLEAQGVDKSHIIVWHDYKSIGNLASFVASCKWIAENEDEYKSTWHIQDDVVLRDDFVEISKNYYEGFANAFCNEQFDGERTNHIGDITASGMWFSFQCIMIPNRVIKGFVEWFESGKAEELYPDYVHSGRCDDSLFREYIIHNEPGIPARNIYPCIVDHIDYLLGGSIINAKQRGDKPLRVAYWRDDDGLLDKAVADLEAKLKNFKKPKKGRSENAKN